MYYTQYEKCVPGKTHSTLTGQCSGKCSTITIFYTQILTRKAVLWSFFMSETSEKILPVKISLWNVIFLYGCKRKQDI